MTNISEHCDDVRPPTLERGSTNLFAFATMTAMMLVAVCSFCTAVAAQEIPTWMRVRAHSFADDGDRGKQPIESPSALASPPPSETQGSSIAARFRQTRARRLLAAGAGFMIAAAITPAYVLPNREPCYGSDDRKGAGPLKMAVGVGAVGLAAAIGGTTWLLLETHRHGDLGSRRERRIAAGIGALTFVLGQALLGTVFIADQIC